MGLTLKYVTKIKALIRKSLRLLSQQETRSKQFAQSQNQPLASEASRQLREQYIAQPSEHQIRYIDNLADLDVELTEVEKAFQISDDEGRRRLSTFQFALAGEFSANPYSPEYAEAQMQIYRVLSGRSEYLANVNEHSSFNVEQAKRSPFPYFTQSPSTVGDQLIAQGYLIRTMNLQAGAKIVEFGPGWGNTTIHLAQMGYSITAVEIEQNFIELIRWRANALGLAINLVNQDMVAFNSSETYDAALFFECFHHCSDHLQLLRNLNTLIKPDGVAVFASEPIIDFPHPWGFVRTDGLTLWSIRRYGWFELGFDTSYFLRTLLLYGWLPHRYTDDITPITNIIIARKSQGYYSMSDITLPPDEAATWAYIGDDYGIVGAGSVLSCTLTIAVEAIECCLSNLSSTNCDIAFSVGTTHQIIHLLGNATKTITRISVTDWQGLIKMSNPNTQSDIAVHWLRLIG